MSKIQAGDIAHNGRPKKDRYNWQTVDGGMGHLCHISKNKLSVNREYQREIKLQTVNVISREFSWAAFGVLVIFKAGEELHIVDGQNRHAAAMRRTDVDMLPCLIFASKGDAQEAAIFLRINETRRSVSAVEKHRAQLMIGDPLAREVEALIKQSGRVAGSTPGPNNFRPVSVINKLAQGRTHDALIRAWPIIYRACEGGALYETILDGMVYIEHYLATGSIAEKPWPDRIVAIGGAELHAACGRAAALYARGGAKVWAQGMLDRINKGMRIRLTLKSVDAEAQS